MHELNTVFFELSLMIIVAAGVAAVVQLLKQPLIIGHILTGLIVGPYFLNIVHSTETIALFSQLGIALLLFIVGLSLSPKIIKEVGKVSLVTGLGQVIVTATTSYGLARLLHLPPTAALYTAIALTFSSTIIILKILSDKRDLTRLYGKISTGLLLIQDLIAVFILIGISSLSQGGDLSNLLTESALKGALLTGLIVLVAVFILPALSQFFAKNQEFLFLFSISWGLGIAMLFQAFGFSIEIGALAAGVALATSPYNYEISARLKPLRDFFIIIFFILLGTQLALNQLGSIIWPALVLSLFVLIAKPFIIMIIMGLLGYNKKTGFKTGMTVAQISEFSLVLMALAHQLGHVAPETVTLVTIVGLITITGSTYLMLYTDKLLGWFEPYLSIFERRRTKSETHSNEKPEIVLFGFDKIGRDFVESFKKLDRRFMVIDYDPAMIDQLKQLEIPVQYGDANDNEFLEEIGLEKIKLVVSTIMDIDTNLLILSHIRSVAKKAVIILKADTIEEASLLYEYGATYVMLPHYISSAHTSGLIVKHGFDLSEFIKEREKHLLDLEKRQRKEYHQPVMEP